jgi:uroporphyrinogen decarboxylase
MLPAAIRFSQLQQEAGKPVSVVLGGVFTLAASLGGIEKLFEWMIGEPDLAHGLLSASRQHLREVARHWSERFGAARLTPIIWEAVASGDLLSPRHFEEFVLPHQQQLNDEILSLGVAGLICHLCGDQSRQASLWAEVPMGERGIVSVGSEVDLRLASEALGHVAVMGNLDPELLRSGSTEHVRNATLDCIERGRRHPAGFILSPGCALQGDIPEANLRAMLRTARELLV